ACFEVAAGGRDFDVRVEPLRDGGGQIIGCIGLAMDVTERRQAANRLRRLQAELAYVGRLSTLGSLAAGLAHELNQPLSAIVCYTQCCRELLHNGTARTEDLLQALDEVTAQGRRAGQIIRRVRDFTRARETTRRAVEVDGLVRQVLDIIAWEAQRHGVDIRLDLAAGLPPVLADTVQIQQVLLDLLHNRIQSQAEQAGARRVVIRAAAAADGAVELSLAGSGTSPAAVLARLGEPFSAAALQDLGMGLTVCQSIIEDHGGRLWAAADPDQGVTFHFTLPPA
ncbi:MAG: ATP-binding protein, partial [Pseudomonadota bacterium]|nr:ATP-binding protein [Pseudomonadota bacterium]